MANGYYSTLYPQVVRSRSGQGAGRQQDRPGPRADDHDDPDLPVTGKKPVSRPHHAGNGRIVKKTYAVKNPGKVVWVTDKKG